MLHWWINNMNTYLILIRNGNTNILLNNLMANVTTYLSHQYIGKQPWPPWMDGGVILQSLVNSLWLPLGNTITVLLQSSCSSLTSLSSADGSVKDIHEGNTGLLGELLMSEHFLQERLFDGLPGAAPETFLTSGLGDHHPAQSILRRRSTGQITWISLYCIKTCTNLLRKLT